MDKDKIEALRAAAEPMRNVDGYMPVRPDAVLALLDTISALTERAERAEAEVSRLRAAIPSHGAIETMCLYLDHEEDREMLRRLDAVRNGGG